MASDITSALETSALSMPSPFIHTNPSPTLLTQGAEALIYKTHFLQPDTACALKYRPSKPYRHPTLDARLSRHRILSEARILVRCRREGVKVPGVLALDWEGSGAGAGRRSGGWMMLEWIEGKTVRKVLDDLKELVNIDEDDGLSDEESLMSKIGRELGKMHELGIVHGDLTTGNLMLRPAVHVELMNGNSAGSIAMRRRQLLAGEIVLIDFGLAAQSIQDEDKAVDLYVLERAFGSTHPEAEELFQEVLRSYGESYKGAKIVLKRLEDVRMRGRKRSMIG